MKRATDVNSYIKQAAPEVRGTLAELRRVIKGAAPKATERISYGIPFYEYGGSGYKGRLIYFAAFKNHISLFIPPSPGKNSRELEKYHVAKSTFHFPLDQPFPFALIGRTVKALVKQRDEQNKNSRAKTRAKSAR
jgi:uncharacterized protein YdhG (YjbR/CyaY superfamily)